MISIFNQFAPRRTIDQTKSRHYPTVLADSNTLLVNVVTSSPLTNYYDYLQLYYHGGGIYTAITFFLDNVRGLHITHGRVLELLKEHAPYTRKKKTMNIFKNPLDDADICTNLRIKTIGTFALNDDSMFLSELVEGGHVSMKYKGKPLQLIDARHGTDVSEFGLWYSPAEQFTEVRDEPNGDFIGTLLTVYNHGLDERYHITKKDLVKSVVTTLLPNLQFQLYNEVLAPSM